MGRPREFELDGAIEKATGLFWRNSYEGTSLCDLTSAIGISPPSFYFAFGSKEGLFRKVIERYFAEQIKLVEAAFRKPTPQAVVMHFLRGYKNLSGCSPGEALRRRQWRHARAATNARRPASDRK